MQKRLGTHLCQARRASRWQANSTNIGALQKYAKSSRPIFLLYNPSGEQVEVVEGVNAPVITKLVADHIPEGMVDTGDDDAAGEGDEEED